MKENAEAILAQLGITPSSAIQMFYRQVVLTQGLDLHLPASQPTCIGGMDARQLREEIQKGRDSLVQGSYTPEQVDAMLHEEFGI